MLSHPNIATLFDVGFCDGRLYLAYEYVQGATLRQQMAGGRMNTRHALDLAVQVAEAVAEAHARGVLHKDLRPDTILETAKGSAKVLDFGMSVWTRGGQTRGLAAAAPGSVPGDALAVVSYMSPEQAVGGRVNEKSDVFSLALIVYEMATGRNPFTAGDVGATLACITEIVPPPPTALNPELPKMFDVVLSRALEKDLTRRTSTAVKLAADLRRCRGLLDPPADGVPPAVRPPIESADLLPLEEEHGGGGLWLLFLLLGAALFAAVYYWMR